MPKKTGILLILAGTALLLSALSLYLYGQTRDQAAGDQAQAVMTELHTILARPASPMPVSVPDETEATVPEAVPAEPMRVVQIGPYGYIGYLSLPTLDLELPVMSEWDYQRLKVAPCRQFGSTKTDDLIIAAHNYSRHFGRLSDLEPGAPVYFTDMDGVANTYEVAKLDTLTPDSIDLIRESGYPLVLYTCTYGGKTRVTVFCNRTDPGTVVSEIG